MALDDAVEQLSSDKEERNKWIGVYIGLLAVLLAICGVGGGNATKDSTRANIEASNTWAFFQAKNIRRNSINLAADELELLLAAQPAMPAAARASTVWLAAAQRASMSVARGCRRACERTVETSNMAASIELTSRAEITVKSDETRPKDDCRPAGPDSASETLFAPWSGGG